MRCLLSCPEGGELAPQLGVEGEREFNKTLRIINQILRVLGSEMNLVTS